MVRGQCLAATGARRLIWQRVRSTGRIIFRASAPGRILSMTRKRSRQCSQSYLMLIALWVQYANSVQFQYANSFDDPHAQPVVSLELQYASTYVLTYTHSHTHAHAHAHTHTYTYIYIYIYLYICICICIYIHIYIYTYIHIYIHLYIYMHAYIGKGLLHTYAPTTCRGP